MKLIFYFDIFYSLKLSTVTVRVRSSNFSAGDVLEISNIVMHENFDKYVYFNDIALIKVRTFLYSLNKYPICMPY